ncbi:MAG: hypothetical protein IJJ41_00415 [Clostridia bacterium]|nr:hypothetical protein [Clostridia bacterium]
MKKFQKCNELAWVFAMVLISLAVCLTTKGGFGVSMIVAPSYTIHLALHHFLPWYSFGTSEYVLQGVLLALMCLIIRKFNWRYLLSFLTAVIYGYMLDLWLLLFGGSEPFATLPGRIASLAAGVVLCSLAVALFFKTYLPLQVYELFVAQVAKKIDWKPEKFKYVYDFCSLAVAIALALLVSHRFEDVRFTDCIGIGTIACTVFNAILISLFSKLLDKFFGFDAALPRLENALSSAER